MVVAIKTVVADYWATQKALGALRRVICLKTVVTGVGPKNARPCAPPNNNQQGPLNLLAIF